MGADVEIETDAIRFAGKKRSRTALVRQRKIERITGFKPQTALREGLGKNHEWFADCQPAAIQNGDL